jgi:predicted permease
MEGDLEAELALHRDLSVAQGNPIPLGNTTRIAEECRDLWRFTLVENFWRDVVYSARALRRTPTLVLTAVLSLAIGLGANILIFSVAADFLMTQPSVTDPGSLVYARVGGGTDAPKKAMDFIRESGAFKDVAGINETGFINWNDGQATRRISSAVASKNFFTAAGVPVAYGRGILPSDPDEVVVLNDRFWRTHFEANPGIVGQTVQLDGKPYSVVGILPSSHRTMMGFGVTPDVYVPRYLDDTPLAMYVRLKQGMSANQARAVLVTVAKRLDSASPAPVKYADGVSTTPIVGVARLAGFSGVVVDVSAFFAILLAIVGLVLLIACVNAVGLLLARASNRKREIATRLALGASRARLVQQFLVESFLLSLLGAACGLGLAQTISVVLSRIQLPTPIPIHLRATLDWRVAFYGAILAFGTTLACGLFPARQAVKESIAPDLRREQRQRMRRTLVIAQIALSLIVLTTGILFLRNLLRSSAISPGFDVRHTICATVNLPPVAYANSQRRGLYVDQAIRKLDAIPGVGSSAAARAIPFIDAIGFLVPITFGDNGEKVTAQFYWNVVTSDFFEAMNIPILQGRTFIPADRTGERVAIVNQAFVKQYLAGRTPAGTAFSWTGNNTTYRIVGVVAGTKNETLGEGDRPQLYESLTQISDIAYGSQTELEFVIRTVIPPESALQPIREALRNIEPAAGLEVATMASSIGFAFLPSQIGASLMGSAGVLGLILAAIGLYGIMFYSVSRRTQEIGIRMALGATRGDISRMIFLDSGKLVATGSVIGLVISVLVTRPLAMFLVPGLGASDPLTFLLVLSVITVTVLVATWGPLRRAVAVDPIASLRYE